MVDRYLTGRVHRISPEAPVPVVQFQHSDNRLGGAANVALNLTALGAKPYLCTLIGNDDTGKIFKGLLPDYKISQRGILSSEDRITTIKTRVMADGQQLQSSKFGNPTCITPEACMIQKCLAICLRKQVQCSKTMCPQCPTKRR